MEGTFIKKTGLSQRWAIVNPVLLKGQAGYETDTRKEKVGDGTTRWNDLPYSYPLKADEIWYDTSKSGLVERNVQGAISELDEKITQIGTSAIESSDGSVSVSVALSGKSDVKVDAASIPFKATTVEMVIELIKQSILTIEASLNTIIAEKNASELERMTALNLQADAFATKLELLKNALISKQNEENGKTFTMNNVDGSISTKDEFGSVSVRDRNGSQITNLDGSMVGQVNGRIFKSHLDSASVGTYFENECPVTIIERDGSTTQSFVRAEIKLSETGQLGDRLVLTSNHKFYICKNGKDLCWTDELITKADEGSIQFSVVSAPLQDGINLFDINNFMTAFSVDATGIIATDTRPLRLGSIVNIIRPIDNRAEIIATGIIVKIDQNSVSVDVTRHLSVSDANTQLSDCCQKLSSVDGELSKLSTTNKNNLVEAINEINAKSSTMFHLVGTVKYLSTNEIYESKIKPNDLDVCFRCDLREWQYYSSTTLSWIKLPKDWAKLSHLVRLLSEKDRITAVVGQLCGVLQDESIWVYDGKEWVKSTVKADVAGDHYYVKEFYGRESDGLTNAISANLILTEADWIYSILN